MRLIEAIRNRRAVEHPVISSWTFEQTAQNLELLQNQSINLRQVLQRGHRPSHAHYFPGAPGEPPELFQKAEALFNECENKEDFAIDKSPQAVEASKLYGDYFREQGINGFTIVVPNRNDSPAPFQLIVARSGNWPTDQVIKIFPFLDFQIDARFKVAGDPLAETDPYITINTTREQEDLYRVDIPHKNSVTEDLHEVEARLRERHVALGRNLKHYKSSFSLLKNGEELITDMLAARV